MTITVRIGHLIHGYEVIAVLPNTRPVLGPDLEHLVFLGRNTGSGPVYVTGRLYASQDTDEPTFWDQGDYTDHLPVAMQSLVQRAGADHLLEAIRLSAAHG